MLTAHRVGVVLDKNLILFGLSNSKKPEVCYSIVVYYNYNILLNLKKDSENSKFNELCEKTILLQKNYKQSIVGASC